MSKLQFKNYAGSLQLDIQDFDGLLAAIEIPKTQWVATAAPNAAFTCDPAFLNFLDTDNNGRVRVEELTAAVRWTAKMLKDRKGVNAGSDTLQLASLSADATLLDQAATLVLEALSKEGSTSISLAEIRESAAPLRAVHFNGDGIIAPEGVPERLAAVINAVISVTGSKKNLAEKDGISTDEIKAFREASAKAKEHLAKKKDTYQWGDASEPRAAAVRAAKPRVDEYFLQCRLMASHTDAGAALKPSLENVAGNAEHLLAALTATPIAPPSADGVLQFSKLFRGKDYETLESLRKDAFEPVFAGKSAMNEGDWLELSAIADSILTWKSAADADKAIALGDELSRITETELEAIEKRCSDDAARKERLDAITQLEKLALYQRWLITYANNFIAMPNLYDPAKMCLFERGKLVLSGRLFTFAALVPDRAIHSALCDKGTMFTMYVKVEGGEGAKPAFEVAIPVTSGTSAGIDVGKRGVFVDHEDKEYDATVLHVIRQPVSLWEAMIMPYQKIGKFISTKIESFASEGDKALEKQLDNSYAAAQTTATRAAAAANTPPAPAAPAAAAAPAPPPQSGGALAGTVAALGVGFGMILAAITTLFAALGNMSVMQLIGTVLGLFAIVSLPSALFAWLKLRKRDIAIVLEGQGWAINERMLLGKHLGPLFTRKPSRPKGSDIEILDSVADMMARRREEGLDQSEPQGMQAKHWALVVLAIVLFGLYQARGVIMKKITGATAQTSSTSAP
ncbi:MAG: kinesin [Deltaproteobacteria bacterium]|nr:kinesin [Deltaproteobacteria bacterium]